MGARKWHVERAKRNEKASVAFESEYPEWAVTALFYSALHYVHSSLADEPALAKDERHPRKHSSPELGTRGVNQLVAAVYPTISVEYRSLMEMAHRTRYDVYTLGQATIPMLRFQWKSVKNYCEGLNQGRPTRSTQEL